ncbi:hypothetical protein BJX63DRAFT_406332 [Aspergillus granulosus]|uniref:Uncharacterized protein n=1 Tax=Aspergillus granulosus TaxID=176169 RepID=A0ABR4H1F1_9EURO
MPYIPTQIRHLISPVHSLCQPQPWHLQFAQRLECWRHIPRRTVSQALGICRHQTTLETRRQIHQTHHDVGATSLLQTDGLRRRGTTVRIPQISAGHSASYSSGPLYWLVSTVPRLVYYQWGPDRLITSVLSRLCPLVTRMPPLNYSATSFCFFCFFFDILLLSCSRAFYSVVVAVEGD